jgi:hypothetical protein
MMAMIPHLEPAEVNLLLSWLTDEAAAQEELLSVLEGIRACMARHDLPGLETTLASAQPTLRHLEHATRTRGQALSGLARVHGLPEGKGLLERILERIPEERRAQAKDGAERLRNALAAVRRMIRSNHVLARAGLDINRSIVHAIFGADAETATYDRAARSKDGLPSRPLLDREL